MAARFRKIGVTTVGACAGLGLAGWALNPFDRQYAVSSTHLPSFCYRYRNLSTIFAFQTNIIVR